jgi:hypothetical protein
VLHLGDPGPAVLDGKHQPAIGAPFDGQFDGVTGLGRPHRVVDEVEQRAPHLRLVDLDDDVGGFARRPPALGEHPAGLGQLRHQRA